MTTKTVNGWAMPSKNKITKPLKRFELVITAQDRQYLLEVSQAKGFDSLAHYLRYSALAMASMPFIDQLSLERSRLK